MHIIANWKMHGDAERVNTWITALKPTLQALPAHIETVLCPPALWVSEATNQAPARLSIGAQECHAEEQGAFTGEISAVMLASAGARYVILGHSERRSMCNETCAKVAAKALAADKAGLVPIICIGETREERAIGATLDVLRAQLAVSVPHGLTSFIVAYEPVWAIGTGLTPDIHDIAQAHEAIIACAAEHQLTRDRPMPVVYGGSVNSTNAPSILALREVAGALVGGASLDAAQFASILNTAASCRVHDA